MSKPQFISFIFSLSVLSSFSQKPFDFSEWVQGLPGTIVDIDSNIYHTHKLGEQVWLKENLKTTKFNNGSEIRLVKTDSLWITSDFPSYVKLIGVTRTSNGLDSIQTDQVLYNYFVVSDTQNVCPVGWKIPDTSDWSELQAYIDKANHEYMSELSLLILPIIGNAGYSSAPYGYRHSRTGEFVGYLDFGYWWSTDLEFIATAWARIQNRGFGIDDIHLEKNRGNNKSGYSIKCIKE